MSDNNKKTEKGGGIFTGLLEEARQTDLELFQEEIGRAQKLRPLDTTLEKVGIETLGASEKRWWGMYKDIFSDVGDFLEEIDMDKDIKNGEMEEIKNRARNLETRLDNLIPEREGVCGISEDFARWCRNLLTPLKGYLQLISEDVRQIVEVRVLFEKARQNIFGG